MKKILIALAVAPLTLAFQGPPANAEQPPAQQAAPRQVFDVSDLETGAPPAIAWATRKGAHLTTIHGPDGATTVPGGDLMRMAFAPNEVWCWD
ncbi:hypothetical protein, partial [Nocardioides sp.]|uniref:hypothetical protein n=1 Tax=Nocardioides sp. TaxID=35761 RepID=UPI00286DC51D